MSVVTQEEFRRDILTLKQSMYGIVLRMGISPDDGADVVQETMIGLWRSRDSIPATAADRRSYCLHALRNRALTYISRRRERYPLDEAAEVNAQPERDAEYTDTRRRIESLIDTLPPAQRQALRLSAFAALDNSGIAEVTGTSETNVRQLLSRGRRRLRDLIDKHFDK